VKKECSEKTRLQKAIADALTALYAARLRNDRALKLKRDATRYANAMQDAKQAEGRAVEALKKHEIEHGC
jgi:hypothetical protein